MSNLTERTMEKILREKISEKIEILRNAAKPIEEINELLKTSRERALQSHEYTAIKQSYDACFKVQEMLSNIEETENRVHLKEQIRLLVFRFAGALAIGIGIVFAGLFANLLGVEMNMPLLSPLTR